MPGINEDLYVKPDNIEPNTLSKNQIINSDSSPVQVRSSQNLMDRMEKAVLEVKGVTLDYRVRSIGAYMDACDGRKDYDPVINITKDIEKPSEDDESDTSM